MINFNVTGMNRFGPMFCTVKTSRNTIGQKKHLCWTNFLPIENIPKFQLLDPSIFWDNHVGSCLRHLGNIELIPSYKCNALCCVWYFSQLYPTADRGGTGGITSLLAKPGRDGWAKRTVLQDRMKFIHHASKYICRPKYQYVFLRNLWMNCIDNAIGCLSCSKREEKIYPRTFWS